MDAQALHLYAAGLSHAAAEIVATLPAPPPPHRARRNDDEDDVQPPAPQVDPAVPGHPQVKTPPVHPLPSHPLPQAPLSVTNA